MAGLILGMSLASCPSWPTARDRCRVTLELVDAATGQPLAGLARAEDAAGAPLPLEGLLPRGLGIAGSLPIHRWSVLAVRSTVLLPREKVVLEAFHGLDTLVARVEADLTGKESRELRIPLRRFYDAGAKGYRNGNTHLHLMKLTRAEADRYLSEVSRADGLDAVFLSYLQRPSDERDYVSNTYTDADLKALSRDGVLFGYGEEHRHNFGAWGDGYGHVMLLDLPQLIRPVSLGPGIMGSGTDGVPLRRNIDAAREAGGTVLWCHNAKGLEDIPNWVAGKVHAQNIFDAGSSRRYKDTFYRYLNAGFRVPFSTGTDWFIYDFSRVYVRLPALATPRDLLRGLAAGRSYITNGPFLEFEAEGRAVGDTLTLEKPRKIRVSGRGAGRIDFRRLELIRNGTVIERVSTRPKDGFFAADLDAEIDIPGSCWLALRIPPPTKEEEAEDPAVPRNEYGEALFAHTSPIYVPVRDEAVIDPGVVKGLIEEVRRSREATLKNGVFADEAERANLLSLYDEAAAALERLLRKK